MASAASPLILNQPWKAGYIIFYFATLLFLVPIWIVYYIPGSFRPHPKWTYRQALMNQLVGVAVHFASAIRIKTIQTLEPKSEKDRFVVIHPAKAEFYRGIASDPEISPASIGAVWYPEPYKPEDKLSKTFIIHFHGGAYVTGEGRDKDSASLANILASKISSKVLVPDYRLSSNPKGHFPAALQDSISAYFYLLDEGVPPSRIAISGDSAGGNLTIALLRYISEMKTLNIPSPATALLWSPWLDLHVSTTPNYVPRHPNYTTDYLSQNLLTWGVEDFVPQSLKSSHLYISPLNHPFATKTPLWMQAGGVEILYDDILKFSTEMQTVEGNDIELWVEPYANHDILLIGWLTGFGKETERCAEKARLFLKQRGFEISD